MYLLQSFFMVFLLTSRYLRSDLMLDFVAFRENSVGPDCWPPGDFVVPFGAQSGLWRLARLKENLKCR